MTRLPKEVDGAVHLPYTGTWDLTSAKGQIYRIQVAWPMHWTSRSGHSDVPVLYLVDGNAMFLTAAEAAWRRAAAPTFQGGGIVVAIGYPLTDSVYSPRRKYDLTPSRGPSSESELCGGAEHLLDFIERTVKPFVASHVLAGSTLGRNALFGHSLGALFGLYALFTRPLLFSCFMCASPSIWFDDRLILNFERQFLEGKDAGGPAVTPGPALMMAYGSLEQHVVRRPGEAEEDYEERKKTAEDRRMQDEIEELYGRLEKSHLLSGKLLRKYPGEDHGTVIACGLSRFLTTFFERWQVNA